MIKPSCWKVHFSLQAEKHFSKLDKSIQKNIQRFIHERLLTAPSPRHHGQPLTGSLSGFWRYRIGDYRLICKIEDGELLILIIKIGHRRDIYD